MDHRRLCGRPGCGEEATASLSFQYANRMVWLDDLIDPEPSVIDLCTHHADRLSVPVGWSGQDRRTMPDTTSTPDQASSGPAMPASLAV